MIDSEIAGFARDHPAILGIEKVTSAREDLLVVEPKFYLSPVEIRNELIAAFGKDIPTVVVAALGLSEADLGMLPASQRSVYTPPASGRQTQMCEIFQAVTSATLVGVDDGLIDLGGDSISGLEVDAQVHELYGIRLGLQRVFDLSTPRAICAAIDEVPR